MMTEHQLPVLLNLIAICIERAEEEGVSLVEVLKNPQRYFSQADWDKVVDDLSVNFPDWTIRANFLPKPVNVLS